MRAWDAEKFQNTKEFEGPCGKVHDEKMKAAYVAGCGGIGRILH